MRHVKSLEKGHLQDVHEELFNKCSKSCFSARPRPRPPVAATRHERLTEQLKHLVALREAPEFDEDNADSNTDSKEVDDVVFRHMAREYLDRGSHRAAQERPVKTVTRLR